MAGGISAADIEAQLVTHSSVDLSEEDTVKDHPTAAAAAAASTTAANGTAASAAQPEPLLADSASNGSSSRHALNSSSFSSSSVVDGSSGSSNKRPRAGAEKLCYVCEARDANAVLLECGHGGVCYECALGLVRQRRERSCPICRVSLTCVSSLTLPS
jgi:Zinc finger, C3HC4 type (RING finger)